MAIAIRNQKEINFIKRSCRIVAEALDLISLNAKIGVSLNELDSIAEDYILSQSARPAFKGLYGFPNTTCLSLNSIIIHGIPSDYKLQNGDILGIDLGVEYDGWYGDGAITIGIGTISKQDERLILCAKDALYDAINVIRTGMYFKELSLFLEHAITSRGFVPLESFCGHGIGRKPHEEPQIPNYLGKLNPKAGPKIKDGMVFCIEPMVCQKYGIPIILPDEWSVVSKDKMNGSHYEHTIAVIGGKAEVLTKCVG